VTWDPMTDPDEIIRSSIGGFPSLPVGEAWPVCTEGGCNKKLALFLQFDVHDSFRLPFETGSTLSVFQCIEHDDPFEALDTVSPKKAHDRLPDRYWDHSNYAIFFAGRANSSK
jgi:hypothetical protein